jgi:aspartyl protease family protein
MNRLHIIAATILGGVFLFAWRLEPPSGDAGDKADASRAAHAAAERSSGRRRGAIGQETVLHRDASGQFNLTAQVNGEDVNFLVDTGADVVALTVDDAQALGLDVDPDRFHAVGETASGIGYGAPVRIDRIEIAGEQFEDVPGVVMEGLTTNLLGQSVLRRLGKVELRGDRMVIHPSL